MATPKRRRPPSHQYTLPLRWIAVVRENTPAVPAGTSTPLPGYLCEACLDAPAIALVPAPWGGEMGVCRACQWRQGVGKDEETRDE